LDQGRISPLKIIDDKSKKGSRTVNSWNRGLGIEPFWWIWARYSLRLYLSRSELECLDVSLNSYKSLINV